ncbi:MAG: SIMPL domain-containing protein [Candidatus Cloacimonetes bacterium]|nr:SIMPL domain-containing protein [Candidatus Cloacimonadota bacterium]MDD4223247.1 SIMPL domain-containing protein [Candidatus Cloacimonadota bacterium]
MSFNPLWIALIAIVLMAVWEATGKDRSPLRGWLIAGICFILGMAVFGYFHMESRLQDKTLHVVGYASKTFESDLVKWTLSVQKNTGVDGLMNAYTSLNRDVNDFKALLLEKGLTAKDINIQPPTSSPHYDDYGNMTGYSVDQMLYVLSNDVAKVEEIALDPQFFAERSIVLEQSNLEYLYSKLPDLKKEMIGAATADALDRANEIIGATKARLGKLTYARSGVFQITEPYSTDVSDYGYYNTNTRTKSISVTVTTNFKL